MIHTSLPRFRAAFTAVSAASLLGIFGSTARAADVTWVGNFPAPGFTFPVWDTLVTPTNWSTGVAPTAVDTAIFPGTFTPSFFTSFFSVRSDGSEVLLLNAAPGFFSDPIAANLVFLNSWKLTQPATPPLIFGLPPASSLILTVGNVSVVSGATAVIDANINLLGGLLTKLGEGALIIGDNTLTPNRTVTGNILIQQGLLGGNFTVTGNLTNSAIFAPGTSPGTVKIGNDYRQTDDGTLRIELASSDSYDRIKVGGEADLDGDLEVSLLNGFRPRKGKKFDILTARGGVDGEFDDVDAPVWENLTLRAFYDEHRVYLKVVVDSFAAVAETPNQRAVGKALDEAIYDERAEKLVHHLYKRDLDELPGDLDEIAPEELSSIFTISTALAVVQNTNLQRRTDDLRQGSSGFSASGLAMQGTGPGYSGAFDITTGVAGPTGKESKEMKEPAPLEEKKWGAFLTGVGEWVDVSGDGNARGYDITTGGFTLGLDYKVTPNFAVGIAAGYAGTAADLTNDGRVWVNGGKLGLYATYFTGGFYVDAAVSGGYNSYDTKRSVLGGTARGDTDGGELNVLAGTGYDWKVGALTIGPTATFQYTLVGIDGFTEQGSLAPLNIAARNAESVRTSLGFKASYDWKVGGVLVRPEIRAAWQHEYGDSSYGLDASFANGAGGSFLVNGPEIGRDSLLLGVGVAIQCSERFSTYFYYDGELGRENYDRHGVSGGVRVAF